MASGAAKDRMLEQKRFFHAKMTPIYINDYVKNTM